MRLLENGKRLHLERLQRVSEKYIGTSLSIASWILWLWWKSTKNYSSYLHRIRKKII